ncbi:hypothetical protein [Nocardia niigatensis]|uniref:hypothetical protein n=1 Tax=Nocardia niigatensis TaxID=209249 RepID=UPI0002D39E87|nr:hypothetical protein [Nocardia niigatensis]
MVKHRRGWRAWVRFRRNPDPIVAAALQAKAFAEAPTQTYPIYDERLEVCVDRPRLLDNGQAVNW